LFNLIIPANLWLLLQQKVLQAVCPSMSSCRQTNSVKTLEGLNIILKKNKQKEQYTPTMAGLYWLLLVES